MFKFSHPQIINFACTVYGRILLSLLMAGAMLVQSGSDVRHALIFFFAAVAVAFLPFRRMSVFLIATCLINTVFPSYFLTVWYKVPLFILLGLLIYFLAQKYGRKGFFAHPIIGFSLLIGVLISLSSLPFIPSWASSASMELALMIVTLFWYLIYGIANITSKKPGSLWDNLAFLHPFWGSSLNPFGKGLSYSSKFEAKTPQALAESQISAVQMMLWIIFFIGLQKGLGYLSFNILHLPPFHEDFLNFSHLQNISYPMDRLHSWGSLISNFLLVMLDITIGGNSLIAIAHFAGFRIPKNTIAPLFSSSIADFWNRYQFYFKELLVDFFFIPAFRKLTMLPEKWRIFVATFFAAGIGNYFFHFLMFLNLVPEFGFKAYCLSTVTYSFYCLILSSGIAVSQLLTPLGQRKTGFRPHICLSVLAFYAILQIFDSGSQFLLPEGHGQLTLSVHLNYLFYLFGGPSSIALS